jgi:hypothetical protein
MLGFTQSNLVAHGQPNDSFHSTKPDLHSYFVPHLFIFALVGSLASTRTSSRIAVIVVNRHLIGRRSDETIFITVVRS